VKDPTVATARVNGAGLYYEDSGSGEETVLFAPGLAWGTHLFVAQVAALGARYRWITFEPRGQGRSEVTRRGYELDNLAVDLAGLIEHLRCAPCHLVGHSLGASVAVRVAARRPELVRSLALVNATTDEDPLWDRILFRTLSYAVELFGMGVVSDRLVKTMFGKTFLTDPARAGAREEARQRFASNHPVGLARTVRGWLRSPPVMDELPSVSASALVIAGEEDAAVKPERSRQTADGIPRSRFLLLPRCGHSAPVEAPEAVTAALIELFEDARSAVPTPERALERP
jgi:pimeloyl-ACP methyl ester carboxylesterase